jgi:hypothetical protein
LDGLVPRREPLPHRRERRAQLVTFVAERVSLGSHESLQRLDERDLDLMNRRRVLPELLVDRIGDGDGGCALGGWALRRRLRGSWCGAGQHERENEGSLVHGQDGRF